MQHLDESLLPEIEGAKQDLSTRLDQPASVIETIRAERVTWPDGSLGCPRPGLLYTQALVRGYFIQLRAAGRDWNYHGGRGRLPRLCDSVNERLPEDLRSGDLTM
ncbi:MAG TPA: hypothetical protein PLR44_11150 [Thermomicrobiales bacterium]|jgi:hypothetical protein|nr:hypothetical protein [Chloroflexota bacterium]HCG29792.1 hypothetical protein [Chloroflexota bacterium]HQZ90597.1 hypothetical protein [Thermomicrobiales bacterium]HRA31981.1 hypothetical protein [Thermomicrobiales bacterium]